MGEVILALQSSDAVHVGSIISVLFGMLGACWMNPFELVPDGDLLILIRRMLDLRGRNTVRVTKVKGHADEGTPWG